MFRRTSLGRRAKRRLFDSTLTLKRYPVIASGIDERLIDFAASPTIIGVYACNVQVYNRQAANGVNAQNYGGLQAKEGRYEVILEPVIISPETDVLSLSNPETDVLVKVIAWDDASHVHLIVDER